MCNFWHRLYVTPVELFIKGTVALRASWRLQPHLSRSTRTPGSRHQCSGVKPWNTIPTYTKENGMETKQKMEKIRFWHRPNLPASSKMSSKVVMVTVCLAVEDLEVSAAVKRGLISWGTEYLPTAGWPKVQRRLKFDIFVLWLTNYMLGWDKGDKLHFNPSDIWSLLCNLSLYNFCSTSIAWKQFSKCLVSSFWHCINIQSQRLRTKS